MQDHADSGLAQLWVTMYHAVPCNPNVLSEQAAQDLWSQLYLSVITSFSCVLLAKSSLLSHLHILHTGVRLMHSS